MWADDRDTAPRTRTVGFQVPAELGQLAMAHALAETVLLVEGFALDEVTDLLLAVDEVVTALVLVAVPGALIDCAFTAGEGALGARISTSARGPASIDEDAFGWHVVATLTDALHTEYGAFDSAQDGYPTTVAFGWIRRAPGPAAA
ncbi:anti-sigma factor [Nocardia rhizosphaerae]|uniref:Anti-sigma factor n=1 Tax=Nocardia rhizosphaerae TaxID=1691571 RepID=A0ABV8LBK7_9NOCA